MAATPILISLYHVHNFPPRLMQDENPDLAREYRIMNIPAVIAIKGGQVAGQQIGLVSKDDMKGFIDGVF